MHFLFSNNIFFLLHIVKFFLLFDFFGGGEQEKREGMCAYERVVREKLQVLDLDVFLEKKVKCEIAL